MEEEKKIVNKLNNLVFTIVVGAIIFLTIFFIRNYSNYQDEIQKLTQDKIKGKIIRLKDLSRGTYSLEIDTRSRIYKINDLHIGFEVDKYNIQIGDSISKEAYSDTIVFYKLIDRKYMKYLDFKIHL